MNSSSRSCPSAKAKLTVYVKNLGREVTVDGGSTLLEVSRLLAGELAFRPVCATVNNKIEHLGYALFNPKTVEFMPVTSPEGSRVYVHSLCFMLYKAVTQCCPEASLSIEHSIARGYYCLLGDVEVTDALVAQLSAAMKELSRRDLPFERMEMRSDEAAGLFERQGLPDKVLLMSTRHEPYTACYRLDGLVDSFYGPLAPSTGFIPTFALRRYKEGLLLLSFNPERPDVPLHPLRQEKMYSAFTDYLAFNRIVGVRNVGELNRAVEEGNKAMVINVSEALHDKRIGTIADRIAQRYRHGGARIVLVAGPSSSGKTTFTKRLAIHLTTNLLTPKMISLDNYFVDRAHTPLDDDGEYDYESLYALDLKAFNDDLCRLLEGEEVELPYYNFTTGEREYHGERISLGHNSVLLIEGIHGLNPELTQSIPDEMKYRVYVSALTTISIDDHNWVPTTDNRLLRRIIRDAAFRGTDAVSTIRRWPSVRRGEERWIFPYQENADSMFNSSLLFELGVLKDRGEQILRRVYHDLPEYAVAQRLRGILAHFESISEEYVPSTSILREFLGGSSFRY